MDTALLAQETQPTGIDDVPDVMADLYLDVVRFANSTPSWVREFANLFTEVSILVLLGLLVLTWWHARGGTARAMAWALLAPAALVVAYLISEWSKTFVEVDRPCRTLGVASIAECPPVGDWSLPSNHATLAGAIAVGVLIAWPRLALAAVPLGLVSAYSRVFVGVHYPHDVIIGFLTGGFVVAALMLLFVRPVTVLVGRLREHKTIGILLISKTAAERQGGSTVPRTHPNHQLPAFHEGGFDPSGRPARELRQPQ